MLFLFVVTHMQLVWAAAHLATLCCHPDALQLSARLLGCCYPQCCCCTCIGPLHGLQEEVDNSALQCLPEVLLAGMRQPASSHCCPSHRPSEQSPQQLHQALPAMLQQVFGQH